MSEEIPTSYRGISYKKLLSVLTHYTLGLTPLPYEDRKLREKELTDISMTRMSNMITSAARGMVERIQLKKEQEKARIRREQGELKAKMFKERFAAAAQSEAEQAKLGLISPEEDIVQKENSGGLGDIVALLEEEEELGKCVEEALVNEPEPEPEPEVQTEAEAEAAAEAAAAAAIVDTQATTKISGVFAERARKRKELREKRRQEMGN